MIIPIIIPLISPWEPHRSSMLTPPPLSEDYYARERKQRNAERKQWVDFIADNPGLTAYQIAEVRCYSISETMGVLVGLCKLGLIRKDENWRYWAREGKCH